MSLLPVSSWRLFLAVDDGILEIENEAVCLDENIDDFFVLSERNMNWLLKTLFWSFVLADYQIGARMESDSFKIIEVWRYVIFIKS